MRAYYIGMTYPPRDEPQGPTTHVQLEERGRWDLVFRTEGTSRIELELAVAALLRHYLGTDPPPGSVRRFLDERPGKSWSRITETDLHDFLEGSAQLDLL